MTSLLDDPKSWLRLWWSQQLPDLRTFMSQGKWRAPLAAPLPDELKNNAGLVGSAVDYRIRWLWPHLPAVELVGVRGALAAMGRERMHRLVDEVDAVARRAGPDSLNDPQLNERLTRLSLVLALIEADFRTRNRPGRAPLALDPSQALQEWMAAQRSDLVDEISLLVSLNHPELAPLLVHTPALNPTFTRSSLTGGADADLIVDGCLIDLKATKKTNLDSKDFMQLVTYALLDEDDLHGIRQVSLWYLRRPQRLTWDLADVFTSAGAKASRSELSKSLVDAGEQHGSERSPDFEGQD